MFLIKFDSSSKSIQAQTLHRSTWRVVTMSKWLAKQPQTSTATATTTCFSSLPRPAEKEQSLACMFQKFR